MTEGTRTSLAIPLLAFVMQAAAVNQAQLLDPQDAFRLSVKGVDKRTAQIDFRIAPGYYLYRDRFRFETESGKTIADAVLPTGKIKEDPFFGRSQIYRDHVSIKVPLSEADLSRKQVTLKIVSQGCADVGVCYIAQEQRATVNLNRNSSP